MAEYVSLITKYEYEIRFVTTKYEEYREIEEAIRKIIDRNRRNENDEH